MLGSMQIADTSVISSPPSRRPSIPTLSHALPNNLSTSTPGMSTPKGNGTPSRYHPASFTDAAPLSERTPLLGGTPTAP